jgi:hypothetical protein
MTKKDYIMLAEALAAVRPDPNTTAYCAWADLRQVFITICSKDNARFNASQFFDATEASK